MQVELQLELELGGGAAGGGGIGAGTALVGPGVSRDVDASGAHECLKEGCHSGTP